MHGSPFKLSEQLTKYGEIYGPRSPLHKLSPWCGVETMGFNSVSFISFGWGAVGAFCCSEEARDLNPMHTRPELLCHHLHMGRLGAQIRIVHSQIHRCKWQAKRQGSGESGLRDVAKAKGHLHEVPNQNGSFYIHFSQDALLLLGLANLGKE